MAVMAGGMEGLSLSTLTCPDATIRFIYEKTAWEVVNESQLIRVVPQGRVIGKNARDGVTDDCHPLLGQNSRIFRQ